MTKAMPKRSGPIIPSDMRTLEARWAGISAALETLSRIDRGMKGLESFQRGPVAFTLDPQTMDGLSVEEAIGQLFKILTIDRAREQWEDVEDLQAEVLARVHERLDKMPLEVLFQLGFHGLRRMAAQELIDVLDKRDAMRRGGAGGRKAKNANTSARPALHVSLEDLTGKDQNRASEIPAPATFILARASKLGPRAYGYFKAIAAGADQKSAAEVLGISTRMARKYQQQLKALLKAEG